MKAPRSYCPHRSGGMVLLELIVALTIFAVISLGLVTALDRAFAAEGDRRTADDAVRGLRNQVVLLRSQQLIPGERDLPNEQGAIAYHLLVAPEPTLDQKRQPILGLYRATITARWNDDGEVEGRSVSTLVYQP